MHNKRLGIACLMFGATIAVADLLSPADFAVLPVLRNQLIFMALLFGLLALAGWRVVCCLVLGVSVFCAGWAAYQQFPGWSLRPATFFGSPNYLGAFAMMCVFLAFVCWLKGFLLKAVVGANAATLLMAGGRAALLGTACGMFFIVPKRWRLAWLMSPFLALVILGVHAPVGNSHRLRNLIAGFGDFLYRPFLGWGQDSPHPSIETHYYNIAMEWLVATGIVGFGLFLWCAAESFLAARKMPPDTRGPMIGLLVAYLVNGMFIYDTIGSSTVLILALVCLVGLDADKPNGAVIQNDHETLLE
jgi:hypothetical protein